MAGGQAITSAQGTLIGLGGDGNVATTGSASTSAAGDVAKVWQSDLDAFKKIREKYLIYK